MAGVGLYLSRTRRDVIFPSPPAQGGAAYAIFRNVPEAEALQRQMGPCPGCDGYAVFVYFLNAGAFREVPEAERRGQPHLFRAGCYYATSATSCGPCKLYVVVGSSFVIVCFRASETNQVLRQAFVHGYGPR